MSPAMPAAASVWPMLPLTEPMASGGRSAARDACAAASARSSTLSPTVVPVPCAST